MSKSNKTISEKMDELSQLVAWFESEDFSLERAVAEYTKAEELASEIEHDLSEIKNEVIVLRQKFDA